MTGLRIGSEKTEKCIQAFADGCGAGQAAARSLISKPTAQKVRRIHAAEIARRRAPTTRLARQGDRGEILVMHDRGENAWWPTADPDADPETYLEGGMGSYIPVETILSGTREIFPDYRAPFGTIVRVTVEVVREGRPPE